MTITLTREEAQQVLECMETAIKAGDWVVDGACDPDFILYLLRARLSAPEPEPVAKFVLADGLNKRVKLLVDDLPIGTLFYTTPPQREWQGLTDEEMSAAMDYWSDPVRSAYGGAHSADGEYVSMIDTWQYIEAKLKEKNT